MKKLIFNGTLGHKQSEYRPMTIEVEKVVEHTLRDNPHVKACRDLMYISGKTAHCVLFLDADRKATEITPSEMPLSSVDFIKFKSMMSTDDYAAFENYFPVLNGELKFNYQGWTDETDNMEISLNELCQSDTLVKLHMFTILDLDNDCVKELILCFDNAGDQLIFHKENDEFFAKVLPYRGFKMLQTNGVYNSSGGAACSHYNKLKFENEEFVEQEWGHACTYEDEVYVVNGNSVSEEEFQHWEEEIMIGEVKWYYS